METELTHQVHGTTTGTQHAIAIVVAMILGTIALSVVSA